MYTIKMYNHSNKIQILVHVETNKNKLNNNEIQQDKYSLKIVSINITSMKIRMRRSDNWLMFRLDYFNKSYVSSHI
jgi:ribosomal protein L23